MKSVVNNVIDWVISWLHTRRLFGPRCDEYVRGCIVCDEWEKHDELFEDVWYLPKRPKAAVNSKETEHE